jgi:nucleoside-diphosphate-sugar epimerase
VHVDDLAALYVAVVERGAPGTIWHGMSQTVALDAVAAALGGGKAVSWPIDEATAALGPLADLFTRDQQVSSAKTRRRLGWTPVHTTILDSLRR